MEKYMDWFWSNILLTKKTFVDLNKIKNILKLNVSICSGLFGRKVNFLDDLDFTQNYKITFVS